MIRAIIFGVDGVLVHPMVLSRVLARDHGLTIEDTAGFFEGPFKRCLCGEADLKAELPRYLKERGWPNSLEDFLGRWLEADSEVNREMLDLATRARQNGKLCYIASTQERYRASYLEKELGFGSMFDGLFFSCRVGCQKPEPEFYEVVSNEVGFEPGELLFFDDVHENVTAARAAGWNAEAYTIGMEVSGVAAKYAFFANRSIKWHYDAATAIRQLWGRSSHGDD